MDLKANFYVFVGCPHPSSKLAILPSTYLRSTEPLCDSLGVVLSHCPQPLQLLGRDAWPADVHRTLQCLRFDLMTGDEAHATTIGGNQTGKDKSVR